MKCFFLSIAFLLSLYFLACNNPATTDSAATALDSTVNNAENVEAFIKKTATQFSEEMQRGDSNALAAHYAEDGLIMPPNSEEVKEKDIAAVWGEAIRMGVKDIKLHTSDISGGGDVYAETGAYEMIGTDNKTIDKGKYLTVWKRENNGWKIYRDIWNTSMPRTN